MKFFYKSTQKIGINANNLVILHFQNLFFMKLLKNIILVIISPVIGWEEINMSGHSTNELLSRVFYPLIIALAASAFIPMTYDKTLPLTSVIIGAVLQAFAYFINYFITGYVLSGMFGEVVKTKAGVGRLNTFIIYNLVYLILLGIISNLMPIDFTPVLFMMLYVIWMVIKGTVNLGVEEEKINKFYIIASAMMLLSPLFIYLIK